MKVFLVSHCSPSALWVKARIAESAMRMSLVSFVIVDKFSNSTGSEKENQEKWLEIL